MGNACETWCQQQFATKSSQEEASSNSPKRLSKNDRQFPSQTSQKQKPRVVDARLFEPANEGIQKYMTNKKQSLSEITALEEAIEKHYLLKNLPGLSKSYLATHMKQFVVGPREVIFEEGQYGDHFYIIYSGKAEVIIKNVRKNILKAGSSFGELALIDNAPRSATVKTVDQCVIWGIDRDSFKEILEASHSENYEENRRFIEEIPLFEVLTEDQKERVVSVLNVQEWPAGSTIVREGEEGNQMFIIKQGTVVCQISGDEIRRMNEHEYFGELALLHGGPRSATILASSNVTLLSLSRGAFVEVFDSNLEQIVYKNSQRIAIERSGALKILNGEQIDKIIDAMHITKYTAGDIVIPAGEPKGKKLWIVLQGTLQHYHKSIGRFSCIGDEFIIKNSHLCYKEPYIATEDSVVAECSKAQIEEILNVLLKRVKTTNRLINILKKVPLLRSFPKKRVEEIAEFVKTCSFNDGHIIVQENTPGNAFFIVKKGIVDIFKKSSKLRSITNNNYFGERSILQNELRTATAIAKGPVVCWSLEKDDFLRIIDENIRQRLIKRMVLEDESITLDDLVPVKKLGQGTFGTVVLCVHRTKRVHYAVKCMNSTKIEKYNLYENLVIEKNILLQLDHPMIIKLVKALKDRKRMYFVLEYVRGMDLFDTLNLINLLNDQDARFYTACLVIILSHLHERSIVHRDLKPENIMIDEDGYPKLIDFGTSKILKGRTYTTLGTPHYMAPEVIVGGGYTHTADLWSLGVMVYEFIYGNVPFGHDSSDPQIIYKKTMEGTFNFPDQPACSSECKHLISQLLNSKAVMRCKGATAKLKEHKWFENYRWDDLLLRTAKAPFIPDVRNMRTVTDKALKHIQRLGNFLDTLENRPNFSHLGSFSRSWRGDNFL